MAERPQDGPVPDSGEPAHSTVPSPGRKPRKGLPAEEASRFTGAQRLPDAHRPLPASLDAEKGVISSILLSPKDTMTIAIERVNEGHFYHPSHSTIFKVLIDLWNDHCLHRLSGPLLRGAG